MSVTAPDVQVETDQSLSTAPHPRAKPVDSRRYRVDLIGVSALLVASAGLAGTLMLFRAQSTNSTTTASVGAPSVSIAPVRDQWYCENSGSQTAAQLASEAKTAAGTQASGPALRDQW